MMNEFELILPVILISFFAVSAIILDAVFIKNKTIGFYYSLFGLLIVLASSIFTLIKAPQSVIISTNSANLSQGMITFGGFSSLFDAIFSIAGILTVLSAKDYLKREYKELNEFFSLILLSVSGMILIAHANNLLVIFIGIEIMSISFYVLAGFFRNRSLSVEASLKYFLLGAFATGFLLYGIALIYGSTGSMSIPVISANILKPLQSSFILTAGIGLIIIGICFKAAAFPFHQWAPDVYHGSPTVVTGFMSTAGKAAALVGFVIIMRAVLSVHYTNNGLNPDSIKIAIAVISALTMIVGNITALVQKNVKRMLAYSSVAHAGYMLMGIAANTQSGWQGIAFYSLAYVFMQIGAFTVVSVLERDSEKNLEISDYAGLSKSHPMLAAVMAIFMFSLAGLPPFGGFFGKYYLFVSAIEGGFTWLTIIAVVASIISMYFYIGLIINMYFKEPEGTELSADKGISKYTLAISALGILLMGIFPSLFLYFIQDCFKFIVI